MTMTASLLNFLEYNENQNAFNLAGSLYSI